MATKWMTLAEAYGLVQLHIPKPEATFLTLLRRREVASKAETITRFNTRGGGGFRRQNVVIKKGVRVRIGPATIRRSDLDIGTITSKKHNQSLDTDFWYVAKPNFESSSAVVLDQGRVSISAEGVLALRADIERLVSSGPVIRSGKNGEIRKTSNGGRPEKYDWKSALIHVISHVDEHQGLPTGTGKKTKLKEVILAWFNQRNQQPDDVGKWVARIYKEIDR